MHTSTTLPTAFTFLANLSLALPTYLTCLKNGGTARMRIRMAKVLGRGLAGNPPPLYLCLRLCSPPFITFGILGLSDNKLGTNSTTTLVIGTHKLNNGLPLRI